ncbi:Ger(x)C family spore germination protein [Aquibacillus rhizosphaerae]|uniref:Ger(X)C family spore germination protein n=1 Tax=Aquibacillus rhizosphaerae TaxID=3051431 RepID=A0ABT7L7K5_9BACI|nr:Ger(x)C family spore germination protein [Aquibacillus sp. LR5S19]MDL4840580.1 Ger(x)C family spore germination protein [Aquibacillus sp. LR5S19]
MKYKWITILFVFSMSIFLGGCWSSRELSDLAITTALGIDKHEEGFRVTAQVMNPGEIAGDQLSSRVPVSTYSENGKTIFEALRRLTQSTPRKLYLSHIRMVVFGQELAEAGLAPALDFISRDHEMRTDFSISVAKDMRAEDLLNVLTPLEKSPANKIVSSLRTSQNNWAPTKVVTLDELIATLSSKSKEPVLTGLYITGDPDTGSSLENVETIHPPTQLHVDNIGVFHNDQLVGWLNESESKGFNYITDNITNTVGWVECDKEGTVSLEITKTNTELSGYQEDKKPKIVIDVKSEANIAEISCTIDINDEKTIQDIEKKIEKKLVDIVNGSIEKAQELNSDIFGFGEVLGRFEPKRWQTWGKNWQEEFINLEIVVNTDMKIIRTGTTTDSFVNDIKKNKNEDE